MLLLLLGGAPSRTLVCPADDERPLEASSGAPISHNIEHVLQAQRRLIEEYLPKPRVKALLCIYTDQIQQLEDALWQLQTLRFPNTAEGEQLDVLGVIVGQERQGLDDDDYAAVIMGRIQANRSGGTPPDLYAVALAALDGALSGAVHLTLGVAEFVMTFDAPLSFSERIMNNLLQDARAASFRAVTIFSPVAANAARYGDANNFPETDLATGLENADAGASGLGLTSSAMDQTTG
jgi:hypothetical protein